MSFDLLIRGGTVYDGTGAGPRRRCRRQGGRIAAIGSVEPAGRRSTRRAWRSPRGSSTSTATPTTRCSWIRGPQRDPPGRHARGRRQLRLRLLPDPRSPARAQGDLRLHRRSPAQWSTAGDTSRARGVPAAVNVLSLVPNGQLRLATLGLADRPPTPRARGMQELLRESLDEGAWGYSTGLEYAQE